MDLHWHLFWECFNASDDDDYWREAIGLPDPTYFIFYDDVDFAALYSGSGPIDPRDADLSQLCRTAAAEDEEREEHERGAHHEGGDDVQGEHPVVEAHARTLTGCV